MDKGKPLLTERGNFNISPPSAERLTTAFERAVDVCSGLMTKEAKETLSDLSAGVAWADGRALLDIAKRVAHKIDCDGSLLEQHFGRMLERVMVQFRDMGVTNTTDTLSLKTSEDCLSSVGGNVESKRALEDALALNGGMGQLLSKLGLRVPTGVLLFGPPGTGKTLLGRAVGLMLQKYHIADDKGASGAFLSLKASDIVQSEVGASEKLIVSAFETARKNAPSVIFIDDLALFGERKGSAQLTSTLLECIDGVYNWSEEGAAPAGNRSTMQHRVVVLGATNAPEVIDKAFLRPGRFDLSLEIGLPSYGDLEEILSVHVSQMKLATSADEICKAMATKCLGFSGADLASLCAAAAIRSLSNNHAETGDGVTKRNFHDAHLSRVS